MSSCKKPKRPLTPYNLFYRFKRGRILQAFRDGDDNRDDVVMKLIAAAPGLEDLTPSQLRAISPKDAYAISRGVIREELQGNLLPFESKRSHRKTHGAMSFLEMGQMMCDQWKLVDSSTNAIFEELADEGKKHYRQRFSEYKVVQKELKKCCSDQVDTCAGVEDADGMNAQLSTKDQVHHISTNNDDESNAHCTQKASGLAKFGDVNIVSPVSSKATVEVSFESLPCPDIETAMPIEVGEDEFCSYIDQHIHPVDNDTNDMLHLQEDVPSRLVDIIDMDESIDHCRLAY
jgi:hypothetical protein